MDANNRIFLMGEFMLICLYVWRKDRWKLITQIIFYTHTCIYMYICVYIHKYRCVSVCVCVLILIKESEISWN